LAFGSRPRIEPSGDGEISMSRKTFTTSVVRAGATPTVTISTAAQDRDGDVVIPTGGDFSNFKKNPVVLWAHDYSGLPVGRCTDLQADATGIRAAWTWSDVDDRAVAVRRAWESGFIGAASIGFRPITCEPNGMGGQVYHSWELLEFSLCPVPANPAATRMLKRLGLWSEEVFDVTEADVREAMAAVLPGVLRDTIGDLKRIVARETKNAIDRARGRIVDDVEDPFGGPVHHWSKSGRVLSSANEARVRRIRAAAKEVDKHAYDMLCSMNDTDHVIELEDE